MSFCFLFQIDPIIQEGNEGVVHHMLLYECSDDFPKSSLSYEGTLDSPDMPPAVKECAGPSIITAWAIGGQVLVTNVIFLTLPLCFILRRTVDIFFAIKRRKRTIETTEPSETGLMK